MGQSLDLDDADRTILRSLRENSRLSLREIPRRSGISDATMQFRLKSMKANGVIERFTIMANPAATGYAMIAIILVQTDNERQDQAVVVLTKIPEITEVYWILGEYDLFVKLWSKSLEELNALINDRIRSIEDIEDLDEIIVVERAKEETSPF
jgi:Lrp/AsnC family transcriptional regulator, regulator for asnA, asnC and gidA